VGPHARWSQWPPWRGMWHVTWASVEDHHGGARCCAC
jgi:hypothetical protein